MMEMGSRSVSQNDLEQEAPAPTKSEKLKAQLSRILDSNLVTVFMTVMTTFALFSDDVRVLAFDKEMDNTFVVFSSLAFIMFFLEIGVQCWCREKYLCLPDTETIQDLFAGNIVGGKWKKFLTFWGALQFGSFYFWLDILATVSMIFEIPWILPANMNNGQSRTIDDNLDSARAGRASRAGARAARVVKIVRMIRLVRLVKLYKYFSENKNNKGEGTVVPADIDKDLDNMPAESRVGAAMSDRTTKKVIVGILIMLIVIPLLQVEEVEYLNEFGMQMVFDRRVGINLTASDGSQSWKYSEALFVTSTNCIDLHYEGFEDGESESGVIPDGRRPPSALREIEKLRLTINTEDKINARSMTGIFDITPRIKEEAVLGILLTTFVIFLLAAGTMTFSRDVNNLVIIPIERMVQLVQEISANPLGKDFSLKPEDLKDTNDGMETTLLLRTISKIAGLLRVGFGEAGAEIIGKNLNVINKANGDEQMNLLGHGSKIQSIFGFCDVRNFTDTTECLQEEVMLFVNRIAHILHSVVVQCAGAANKNIGDAFLLTWKMDPKKMNSCKEHDYTGDKALYSLLKTMVEMTKHEDFICNFSATALGALYERMPGYKCRLGCGLHFGWAIEGAIGSDKKIDASYISPHVNWAEFLEGSTKEYGVPLLMSEPFFRLLSPTAVQYCRQVDNIKKSPNENVVGIYAYDANFDNRFDDDDDATAEDDNYMNDHDPNSLPRTPTDHPRKTTTRRVAIQNPSFMSSTAGVAGSTATVVTTNPEYQRHTRASSRSRTGTSANINAASNNSNNNSSASRGRKPLSLLGDLPEIVIQKPFSPSIWHTDEDMARLRRHFKDGLRKLWSRGITSFISGDWSAALLSFEKVLTMTKGKDGPAKILLGVMEGYNYSCPENWGGYRELYKK